MKKGFFHSAHQIVILVFFLLIYFRIHMKITCSVNKKRWIDRCFKIGRLAYSIHATDVACFYERKEIWQPLYKIAFRMTELTKEDFLFRFLQMLSYNSHSQRNKIIVRYFALLVKNKSKQCLLRQSFLFSSAYLNYTETALLLLPNEGKIITRSFKRL